MAKLFHAMSGVDEFNESSLRVALRSELPSRTKQSQKEEADINTLVKRFGITGNMPVSPLPPTYGDFSIDLDFRKSMDMVNAGRKSFETLPAAVRKRFGNDPMEFVQFSLDPKNGDELVKLGLAVKREAPPPSDTDRIVDAVSKIGKNGDDSSDKKK